MAAFHTSVLVAQGLALLHGDGSGWSQEACVAYQTIKLRDAQPSTFARMSFFSCYSCFEAVSTCLWV